MAFVSAIPLEEFNDKYLEDISYRGPKMVNITINDYVFTIGNYSENLLSKSYKRLNDNVFVAFDTTPWACENLLPNI